jgi:hypothetical protein
VVRADGVVPNEVKILQPVNRFRRSGAQWDWNFEKLEPTLADDLSIEAVPQESSYGRSASTGKMDHSRDDSVDFIERAGKWYIAHTNYSVTASSTLPPDGSTRYDATYVREWNAVRSEGAPGPGIGEWLELKPEVARPLRSVRIWPGHCGSQTLFQRNARPKRIELLLNGEHRFDASLDDDIERQTILVEGYDKPVKSLRLTILDAYPGSRHDDLCISRIMLETRATKIPKITPAR